MDVGKPREARLTNSLVDKMPNLVGLSQANDENREPVISIPYLLRMEEFKVDYIDGYPDGEYWANLYLRFEHGSFARSGPGQTTAETSFSWCIHALRAPSPTRDSVPAHQHTTGHE